MNQVRLSALKGKGGRRVPENTNDAPVRSGSYSNFNDPLGLIYRMLRTGDPAARYALCQAGLKIPFLALDRLLEFFEARRLQNSGGQSQPILLVVGPPRSGTTLVYQVLSEQLPVSYFDNWGAMFPRSTITASRLLKRYSARPRTSYHSYYGNTAGFRGVNDGFHVWNRWLGNDRYSVPEEIDLETRKGMQQFFAAWSEAFGLPLLNKNNRNTLCMSLLASVLENAVFVVVTREPVFAAQSLMIAREHIQGDAAVGWGLGANRSRSGPKSSPLEDVADQVRFIYERLQEQLDRVPRERVVHVRYEDFCAEPSRLVARMVEVLRERSTDSTLCDAPVPVTLSPLVDANTIQLPKAKFDALKAFLEDIPGVVST